MGYVTQDDIVLYTLTPREQIRYRLTLEENFSSPQALEARIDQLLARLSLTKASDTVIGAPGLSTGVSGGERKRVNVSLSLCSQPDLLLLDEPTSGLDARKARELCTDLKKLSEDTTVEGAEFRGCTIVATIHQPSADTFRLFNKVLLLHAGEVCFMGSIPELEELLAEVGAPVPAGANVAEFVMDVLEDQVGIFFRRWLCGGNCGVHFFKEWGECWFY